MDHATIPTPATREDVMSTAPPGLYVLPEEKRGPYFDVRVAQQYSDIKQRLWARVKEGPVKDFPVGVDMLTIRSDGNLVTYVWVGDRDELREQFSKMMEATCR